MARCPTCGYPLKNGKCDACGNDYSEKRICNESDLYYTIEYHGQRFKCYIESVNAFPDIPSLTRDIDGKITRMRTKTRYQFTLVTV